MCIYKNGKISSFIFEQLHGKNPPREDPKPDPADQFLEEIGSMQVISNKEVIQVSSRDFLASLSRIMQFSDDYFRRMFDNDYLSRDNLLKALDISALS